MFFQLGTEFTVSPAAEKYVASFCLWWLGINCHTSAVAYSEKTHEIRLAVIIEAETPEQAGRIWQDQLSYLLIDLGLEETYVPKIKNDNQEWMDTMLIPFRPDDT